jgi:ABC-type dipeptide/oligopeptide/nickel transport system permease subunit
MLAGEAGGVAILFEAGLSFPGLAIFASVLALSLVGDWLNDVLNPRSKT